MIHSIQSVPILKENLSLDFDYTNVDDIEFSFKPANNNYFSKNTQILELPYFENLKKILEKKLIEFQKNVLCIEQELYITESWLAKTIEGGCHARHNHPNSLFSGVFYIQTPENSFIDFHYENYLFKFFNFQYTYNNINEFNSSNISISVEKNDFVIFPSWLDHSVNINTSKVERIILGFNTFVKGTFGNNEYPTRLII